MLSLRTHFLRCPEKVQDDARLEVALAPLPLLAHLGTVTGNGLDQVLSHFIRRAPCVSLGLGPNLDVHFIALPQGGQAGVQFMGEVVLGDGPVEVTFLHHFTRVRTDLGLLPALGVGLALHLPQRRARVETTGGDGLGRGEVDEGVTRGVVGGENAR